MDIRGNSDLFSHFHDFTFFRLRLRRGFRYGFLEWNFNIGESGFLEALEDAEGTFEAKDFLAHLGDGFDDLLNVFFNVKSRHYTDIKFEVFISLSWRQLSREQDIS